MRVDTPESGHTVWLIFGRELQHYFQNKNQFYNNFFDTSYCDDAFLKLPNFKFELKVLWQ